MTSTPYRTRVAADLAHLAHLAHARAQHLHDLARSVDDHLARLDAERRDLGWPSVSGGGEHTGGKSELTIVERAADRLWNLNGNYEDVRDAVRAMRDHFADGGAYARVVAHLVHHGRDLAADLPACCDNQVGKHAADEWGDPHCPLPGVRSGLCTRHYTAWYRARRRDGIDVSRDHEPGAA